MLGITSGNIIFQLGKWIFLSMTSAIFKLNSCPCHSFRRMTCDLINVSLRERGMMSCVEDHSGDPLFSKPSLNLYVLNMNCPVSNSGEFIENVSRSRLQKAGEEVFYLASFHSAFRLRYRMKMTLVTLIHRCQTHCVI